MKSRHCDVCQPVRISLTRLWVMLYAGPGTVPPGGVNKAMLALLMIEQLVWACRYRRLMYCPNANSPKAVVSGPGLGGESGESWAGFQSVQALPNWSTPAGLPPVPLKGFDVNPAAMDAGPGPCASARSPLPLAPFGPFGFGLLVRTMWVWSSKTNTSEGTALSA